MMRNPPLIKPMQLDALALPSQEVMRNGVSLYRLGGNNNGAVRLDILFKGGYAVQEKPLQAMFVNRMLREGAGSLSAAEISQKLDYYGAWIDMYSSQECNHITLYTLSKHFIPLLGLLETMVKNPTFPEENLETTKRNNKSFYMINSRKVDVVSQRYFEHSLWGEGHPLAHIVVPEDYDAITVDDLWSYYRKVYASCNCSIFIAGTFDECMTNAVAATFGNEEWGAGEPVGSILLPPAATMYGRRNIAVKDTMQSAVKIGFMAMDSSHSDFHRFRVLSVLFGGYFGSRLMSNIREENGYTYHISAELDAYGNRNSFMISSEAANEYVEPLIFEVKREIKRLLDEPIPEAEVELVRNYIMGELCREYEGLSAKSEVFINAWLSGEKFSSVNDYISTVQSVGAAELREVARKYLSSGDMIEIVAGAV